jgi:hypothetical protein
VVAITANSGYVTGMDISVEALQEAVSIRQQIDTLQKRLSSILTGSPASAATGKEGRRPMPAATRAKLAAAARARWARIKGQTKATPPKKKGGITPAGRKRLSQLMKARWAARRRGSVK